MRPRPSGRGIRERRCLHLGRATPFNEASTIRSRNRGRTPLPRSRCCSPSMRPRPSGRGICTPWSSSSPPPWSFNEASTIRSRNHCDCPNRHCACVLPFNEASTIRSRNLEPLLRLPRDPSVPSMRPRPSGRGIPGTVAEAPRDIPPSMRPRPSGRGIRAAYSSADRSSAAFNEASTIRSRNPGEQCRTDHHHGGDLQ